MHILYLQFQYYMGHRELMKEIKLSTVCLLLGCLMDVLLRRTAEFVSRSTTEVLDRRLYFCIWSRLMQSSTLRDM